jgi:outer membrane protein OmpA-like peptidoglycan-associated protein
MERNTIIKGKARAALGLGALLLALSGCAHAPSDQLVDARRAYHDAASSPARTRRPNELEAARVALERAEDAHAADPGSAREKRLAAEAEHKSRLAQAHGDVAEAQRDAAQAEREAAEARARANANATEAERERERADASDTRRSSTRERTGGGEQPNAPARHSQAALQNLAAVANVREEPRGVVITLSGSLLFPSGDQQLSPIARQNLDQVAHALAQQPKNTKFLVEGHTDNSGNARENKQLSAQRAHAVAEQLEESGIARDRIEVEDYGETRPIAGNDTAEGRAANRRVEIVVEPTRRPLHERS